jgi:hypothetical protein
MKKILFTVIALMTLGATTGARAQVTIGSTNNPQSFSILELDGDGSRGLRLPQMTASQRNALNLAGNAAAQGLQIFNTTTECVETWNGTKWIAACGGEYVRMPAITPECANGVVPPPVRFMKYNLGADPSLDTPKKQIKHLAECDPADVGRVFGGRFQWGRKWDSSCNDSSYAISVDGKYTLYSSTGITYKSVELAAGATYHDNGQINTYNGTNSATGMHVYRYSPPYDWRTYDISTGTQKDDLWGNGYPVEHNFGTEIENKDKGGVYYDDTDSDPGDGYYQNTEWVIKGNNPCPAGFRVPTQDEWEKIVDYDCNPSSIASYLTISFEGTSPANNKGLVWVSVAGGKVNQNLYYNDNGGLYGGQAIYDTTAWNPSVRPGGYFDQDRDGTNDMNLPLYEDDAPEPLIFLPGTGYRNHSGGSTPYIGHGHYWSSTVSGTDARLLSFSGLQVRISDTNYRVYGMNIRCVVE